MVLGLNNNNCIQASDNFLKLGENLVWKESRNKRGKNNNISFLKLFAL